MPLLPSCIKCNQRIPLSWFIWSAEKTKYRCVKCSALHGWKSSKWSYIQMILILLCIIGYEASKLYIDSAALRLLVFVAALLSIRLFVPHLYGLEDEQQA